MGVANRARIKKKKKKAEAERERDFGKEGGGRNGRLEIDERAPEKRRGDLNGRLGVNYMYE